ncbi:MAG TPA: hypothetical protein VFE51_19625 [Verrucomicrobiae bacterium]|nr:hypothetical protein [Verrucomicrobiae bacterium]
MNHYLQLSAIVALLLSPLAHARADQTNLVQDLRIHLDGIAQGQTVTNRNVVTTSVRFVRVNSADVIKQLGTATGNSFSSTANLVLITPLGGGTSSIAVRDGTTSVDVTSFFQYEVKSASVSSSELNLKTGRASSTEYSIQRLALVDSAGSSPLTLHFDVQGVAVDSSATSPAGTTRTGLDAAVSGWGDQNANSILLEGTFRLEGNTLEVVSSAPPPNV